MSHKICTNKPRYLVAWDDKDKFRRTLFYQSGIKGFKICLSRETNVARLCGTELGSIFNVIKMRVVRKRVDVDKNNNYELKISAYLKSILCRDIFMSVYTCFPQSFVRFLFLFCFYFISSCAIKLSCSLSRACCSLRCCCFVSTYCYYYFGIC